MSLEVKTGVSMNTDTSAAVQEIVSQVKQDESKLVVFFSTMAHDGQKLVDELGKALPDVKLIGCSTAGEITPKGFLTKSLTAMSFASGVFNAGIGMASGLSRNPQQTAAKALEMAVADLGGNIKDLDPKKHVLMVLPDGLSGKEEACLEGIKDIAPELVVVGGSAGDDLQFKKTYVCGGKQASSDAIVVALIKTSHPWAVFKTSSYEPSGKVLKITKADPEQRIVYEFDHKPAAVAYAEAINTPLEKIADVFMDNPVAVNLPDGFYNRSPQQLVENQGIKFYCNIAEGATVSVMNPGDVKSNLAAAVKGVEEELNGSVSAIIAFNCILRYLEAEKKKISPELFEILKVAPVIGFATYGEQYNALHINQTLTMLAFGE